MAKNPDNTAAARKMFDQEDPDDLIIETERSRKRVTIRDEAKVSLIRRRSPAQFIPISGIVKRSNAQVRLSDFDPDRYPEDKSLLESIRHHGVVTPVMVKEFMEDEEDLLADTQYELIYGHRRVSACKVLGFTTIPAFIVEPAVESDEVTMTENIGVRTLSAYERGREFDRYLSSHDITLRAFAEMNGFPHSYVSELISAYRSVSGYPELAAVYQDGMIRSRFIPALVQLYEKSPEPVRELLIERIPDLSQKQIKELLEVCRTGGSAAGFLKSADTLAIPADAVDGTDFDKHKATPEEDIGLQEKKEPLAEITEMWEGLESDRTFMAKQSALYTCSEEDVKEAVQICRKGNARPELLRCMLLIRKNGGTLSDETLASVKRVVEDSSAGKAVSLYISAYEKMNERRLSCERRLGSLGISDSSDLEVLKKLFAGI